MSHVKMWQEFKNPGRGGSRPGCGRPKTGRREWKIWASVQELKHVQRFLVSLRSGKAPEVPIAVLVMVGLPEDIYEDGVRVACYPGDATDAQILADACSELDVEGVEDLRRRHVGLAWRIERGH